MYVLDEYSMFSTYVVNMVSSRVSICLYAGKDVVCEVGLCPKCTRLQRYRMNILRPQGSQSFRVNGTTKIPRSRAPCPWHTV
jgi:hypothetical protein